MTGSRLRPRVLVGLFLALLAVALQGVQGEEELGVSQVPSEVECRPYIEKALKDLGTGSLEESSAEVGDGGADDDDDQVPALNEQNDEPTETDNDDDDDNDNNDDNDNDNDVDDEAGKDGADQSTKELSTEDNDEDGGDNDGQDSIEGGEEDELIAANESAEDGIDGASSEDTDGDDDNVETIEVTSDEVEVQTPSDGADDTDDDDDQKDDDNSADEADDDGAENEGGEEQDDGIPTVETEETPDNDGADESTEEKEDDNTGEEEDGVANESNESKEGDSDENKNDTDSGEDNTDDNDSAEDKNDDNKTDEDSKEEENHSNSAADDGGDSGTEDTREDNSEEEKDGASLESVEKQDNDDNDDDDGSKQVDVDGDDDKDDVKNDDNDDDEDSKKDAEDSKEDSNEGKDESKESKEDGDDGTASASTESPDDDTKSEESKEVKSRARREVGDEVKEEKESEEDKTSKEGEDDEDEKQKTDSSEEVDEKEESEGSDEDEEDESTPEEDLIQEIEVPENLRPREHINQLLKLDEENEVKERAIQKAADIVLRDLKRLYDTAIKPLETLYKYRDLSNRHFGDPEIFSKPLVLFMGPWSGGKSSIVNYLLDNEYKTTALRTGGLQECMMEGSCKSLNGTDIGAEPSPAYFNILMYGEEEEILDGTQLAADWTFSGLQKFGQGMLDRLRGVRLKNKLLEKVNIVEIPGILEIRKQVQRLFPFNDACQWFIDRADIIFLVYDPAKLDVGPETEAILDQLKGREYQTRIILNKADQVKPEELMRVQGALIWNISPLMSSAEPPVMYSTSLWSMPYEAGAPTRLLYAQERAFLRDLRSAIDKRVEHKIASARRFAVRVRNHAKMVDCYLTTYYNQKSFFGNKKDVSDKIIENPQNYHIYEGLSTLTNISRYDLPDPDVYKDFFRLNSLYDFQQLSSTCTYFRGCPINRLDIAIAYDLPELVGKYKKSVEAALHEDETNPPPS